MSCSPSCPPCQEGRASLCEAGARANTAGTLLSGARRFRHREHGALNHHLGVSSFAEYTVAAAESLVKIDPDIPLDVAALFGCAVMTGVGAVVNTAHVKPGSAVAVFGLGGVGLSALLGARASGAHPLIAVDPLPEKRALARRLGASDTLDAGDAEVLTQLKDLTDGGAHYTFESVGSAGVLAQAYAATRRGGTTVSIGLPHPEQRLELSALSLVAEERTLKGSYMGSSVPSRDIPRFLAMYRAGLLPVDELISRRVELGQLNEAFDALDRGEVVRQLLVFGRDSAAA